MAKINVGRVILGGIVAGLVADVLGFLADGVMLSGQWAVAMTALGKQEFSASQNVGFIIIGLLSGIFSLWLYAAIRPRYGAGPKTAVYAGLAAWFVGGLLPNIALMGIAGLFPIRLTIMTTSAAIIESVAGTLAGAALYREEAAPTAQSRAARA